MRGKMKKVTFSLVLLSLFMFGACQSSDSDSSSAGNPGNPGDPGTGVVNKSIKLNDANGNFIGYVTELSEITLSVSTSKNYLVRMDWHGNILENKSYLYFKNVAGVDKMFILYNNYTLIYGKFVVPYNGKIYIPSMLNADGFVEDDTSVTEYTSYYNGTSIITPASPVAVTASQVVVTLAEAQRSDVGLPATIALPLKPIFE
jgi:hypothetical protein